MHLNFVLITIPLIIKSQGFRFKDNFKHKSRKNCMAIERTNGTTECNIFLLYKLMLIVKIVVMF